jgi:signal transduction histidine kinase
VDWPRNEALSPVPLDPIHFKEVLSHIFTNARQAMPQGGKLSVRTTQYTLSPQDVSHELGNRSGVRFRAGDEILLLEIQDTGHGIPEQNRSAVFDAFFTTKPAGTAVGLGLTVSRKIMELHGGSIELSHPESGGTCVTLRLKQ